MIYQITLFDWMGSNKLAQIILNKIEDDKNNNSISELEKYLSVFLYGDLKSKNYLKICKDFIRRTKQNYILDLSFFKIYTYYFLRGKKASETEFLNILGDLQTRILKVGKEKKSKIIQKIKAIKKQKKT